MCVLILFKAVTKAVTLYIYRKFFVDALPMVGSEASLAMMTQMLMSNDISGLEADMWLTSLSLIQEPSPAMLQEVAKLLQSPALSHKSMLPVSTMMYSLCQHQSDCTSLPAVQAITTSLTEAISSTCYVNKKNFDQVSVHVCATFSKVY